MPGCGYILSVFTLLFLVVAHTSAATDIRFTGALVAEPCVINAEDEVLELDFSNILDRELYVNHRSQTQPLTITLTDCSIDTAKSVTITFSGNENSKLPGYLAINAESSASGFAIGMETLSGQAVLLNKGAPPVSLESGRTLILLRAFILGEANAIRDRTITYGAFSAVATFHLNYQ